MPCFIGATERDHDATAARLVNFSLSPPGALGSSDASRMVLFCRKNYNRMLEHSLVHYLADGYCSQPMPVSAPFSDLLEGVYLAHGSSNFYHYSLLDVLRKP